MSQLNVGDYVDQLLAGDLGGPVGALPPHFPTCFGCGPESEAGLHLVVRLDAEEVVAEYTFAHRHSGAPGIAHGGIVAALIDDLLGYTLFVAVDLGVTRRLEVDYLRPVLVGASYQLRGRIDRREGRKIFTSCEMTAADGTVVVRAQGLFVVVPLSHFG